LNFVAFAAFKAEYAAAATGSVKWSVIGNNEKLKQSLFCLIRQNDIKLLNAGIIGEVVLSVHIGCLVVTD